jgi:hypothetical protein
VGLRTLGGRVNEHPLDQAVAKSEHLTNQIPGWGADLVPEIEARNDAGKLRQQRIELHHARRYSYPLRATRRRTRSRRNVRWCRCPAHRQCLRCRNQSQNW